MAEGQAKTKRTGSVVGSLASVDSKGKPRIYPLWPEYNENDINAEKWEGSAKGKEKGKSPNMQFFDDPEGRVELPPSIKVDHWKRPQDFITAKIPVVVDNENYFNLMSTNEHLCHSQLMRTVMSQIMILWDMSRKKPSKPEHVEVTPWCPWEHIYSLCKAGKGHMPLYNQFGKYIVRLYWMGVWRKIVVDDLMPFDMNGKMLLPSSTCENELWPMLLAKALIKIASIDFNVNADLPELGDFYVIQCLTGWIPETIPLRASHNKAVWELIKKILPEWTLPKVDDKSAQADKDTNPTVPAVTGKPTEPGKADHGLAKTEKPDKGSGKDAKGGKESSRKREDKEKNKLLADEPAPVRAEDVQMLMCATFSQYVSSPAPMTLLREMAASSEQLRKVGLSHLHTHPVFITQTRSCSLIPPVPVPEVPRWKLIRPHKKKAPPTDEPQPEPEVPKPDQWVEIMSPFIGYRPPLNVVDKAQSVSVSGSSMVLNEIEEEALNTGGEKMVRLKPPPSTKSVRRQEPVRKGTESQASHHLVHSATVKVDSADDVSGKFGEEEGAEEGSPEEEGEVVVSAIDEDVLKKSWVDFDDFCNSFTNVTIFHKPHTYPHNESVCEFKQAVLNAGAPPQQHGGKKGSAQPNTAGSNTNVARSGQSPVVPKSYEGYSFEERTPGFLFVDSVKETELIISYSVLPRWLGLDDKRISDRESVAGASEAVSYKQDVPVLPSGLLVVEQYSWKSLVTGQPILRIRTTGTKSACLTLPAGRHVLRFVYNSPLGYHVHICSTTKFVFGDEDSVMLPLKDESCRFVEASTNIMACLDKCLETFGNEEELKAACKALSKAHMPYIPENKRETMDHYQSWHSAVYATVLAALAETKVNALTFGLRTLLLDLQPSSVTPVASEGAKEVVESWVERSATEEEERAAELIQRNWKGTYARKIVRARSLPDSNEQRSAIEVLKAVRTALQTNSHAFALMLLRNLLKDNIKLISKFPFYKDEWNRISYTDYMGTYSEQPVGTWFVVFREVLYVEQDVLCVPRVYVSIPTCMLRVINNDTGEELKKVFQKVAPQWYKKNKRGYTFVAEARTLDQPLVAGKWKLRLIGSTHPLPTPQNSQLTSVFAVKEIKDYYIPNKNHILLRYTIKCNTNLVGSLQLQTSKSEAVVQFKIYDNGVEMASARGKGHCVIPAFFFLTNNRERITSGNSSNENKGTAAPQTKGNKKVTLSGKKNDGKTSPLPAAKEKKAEIQEALSVEDDDNTYAHNYILEAKVERKTWPLTRNQWTHVEKLKENEKEELKAFSGGQRQGLAQKQGGGGEKGKKGAKGGGDKGGKEKKNAEKDIGSRPSSQSLLEESRANWLLRFVCDAEIGDEVELKKDVQRQEEIRAMKQAWETAEPGRAVKAMQSRLNYLSNNLVKGDSDKENDDEDKSADRTDNASETATFDETELLFSPPPPPPAAQKDTIKPFDFSPYIKPLEGVKARYVNPEDLAAIDAEQQKLKVEEHNVKRDHTQTFRDRDRTERMMLKEQQLEACRAMQYEMDRARTELLKPRDAYRHRLLEEKRLKDEAAEAAAAAALAASEAASPDAKGKKSAKKKK